MACWGVTTEELEGFEDCSFAAEPKTVSISSMQSLRTSGSVGAEIGMGQYGSQTPGKHRCPRRHKWSYLIELNRAHRETWYKTKARPIGSHA